LLQVLQLKCFSVLYPDVGTVVNAVEVIYQVHQFFVVLFVVVVWNYRDAVIELISETIDSVVNNDQVTKVSVLDDSEVFDVYSLWRPDAVVTVEPVLDQSLLLLVSLDLIRLALADKQLLFVCEVCHLLKLSLEGVKDHVCVGFVRGCENGNLVVLISLLEAFVGVGTDVDTSFDRLSGGELDGD